MKKNLLFVITLLTASFVGQSLEASYPGNPTPILHCYSQAQFQQMIASANAAGNTALSEQLQLQMLACAHPR